MTETALAAAALLLALLIDLRLGEPPSHWHPVVGMGSYLGWAGKRVAPVASAAQASSTDYRHFVLGALYWCAGEAMVYVAALGVQAVLLRLPAALGAGWGGALAVVLLGLALKPLLAWAMLRDEVQAVENALGESLDAGRQRLSWLVSRDVDLLTEAQVRESAIESLAENLNDSVVAPVFWFLVLGLPGAALYRFANTADAMWGYRGVRHGQVWEWGGKWAAWADDLLSWLPARLTALLLMAVMPRAAWRSLRQQARLTPSPNSGWPMAAMALGLGLRLGKPGVYTLNPSGRLPESKDMALALAAARRALLALVCSTLSVLAVIASFQ